MSRFVRPDTCTLRLSHGDTLLVRRRLNAGEQRAAYARMYAAGVDGALRVNPLQTGIAVITAYLLDWSLTDDHGVVVAIRDAPIGDVVSALDALDPESFAEIQRAIETHDRAMQAERSDEKKSPDGVTPSSVTSPSLGDVAGGTNG